MNYDVIVTCAVTGAGDTVGKHPAIPVTPKQIADAAIEAAKAGAAIAHMHVRDPKTGKGSRESALYREVVERVRDSGTDVIINLTAGMGGDLEVGADDPRHAGPGTDLVGALERLVHVEELLPEICTLDCGTSATAISSMSAHPPSCAPGPSGFENSASSRSSRSSIPAISGSPNA